MIGGFGIALPNAIENIKRMLGRKEEKKLGHL